VKTIEEYATDLVCNGAESHAEDDLNESGEVVDDEHEAAMDLAIAMARAIRVHADEVIGWARGAQAARAAAADEFDPGAGADELFEAGAAAADLAAEEASL
jgi:hypothetical protein